MKKQLFFITLLTVSLQNYAMKIEIFTPEEYEKLEKKPEKTQQQVPKAQTVIVYNDQPSRTPKEPETSEFHIRSENSIKPAKIYYSDLSFFITLAIGFVTELLPYDPLYAKTCGLLTSFASHQILNILAQKGWLATTMTSGLLVKINGVTSDQQVIKKVPAAGPGIGFALAGYLGGVGTCKALQKGYGMLAAWTKRHT